MQKLPPCRGSLPLSGNEPAVASARPPVVLTIAGFDPSCGAGLTADLKVFAAHRLFGVACATALTVQSTQGVRRSEPVTGALIAETLACLSDDLLIAGIKIGMLGSSAAVEAVAEWLLPLRETSPGLPVVLDPVLRASSGAKLLPPDAVQLLLAKLLPLVSILTPNVWEAALLAGLPCRLRADIPQVAQRLHEQTGAAVLVTGGHLEGSPAPEDYLLDGCFPEAGTGTWHRGEWVRTEATHGTGCALSSALLCRLVQGFPLEHAVPAAKQYVESALRAAYPVGQGKGPMHHLFRCDTEGASEAADPSE